MQPKGSMTEKETKALSLASIVLGILDGKTQTITAPTGAVARGEKLLGKVTRSEIQAFYESFTKLKSALLDAIQQVSMMTEHPDKHSVQDLQNAEAECARLASESQSVKALFWNLVRLTVPGAADEDTIGIREDWAVVSIPQMKEEEFAEVLRRGVLDALLKGRFSREA